MDKREIVSSDWGRSFKITRNNKSFYMLVVFLLGMIAISIILCVAVFAYHNKEIPGSLIAIASGAVGALVAIFNRG